MGTFQKKKWEKKCGGRDNPGQGERNGKRRNGKWEKKCARDNPGQGERRMSYYRDREE